jgi:hypothetical protein
VIRRALLPTTGASKAANDLTLTCSGDGRQKPNKLGWAIANAMLPTPVATNWKEEGFEAGKRRWKKYGTMHLSTAVRLLPSLTASMQTMADFFQAQYAGSDPQRPNYAATKRMPTPRAQERQQHNSQDAGVSLSKLLATPNARDWRSGKGRQPNGHSPQLPEQLQGSLNPTWEGWYMGWPMDWEALPGTSPTYFTPMAFLLWLLEYRIALNALWRSVMARCPSVPHWPGESSCTP